MTFSEKFADIFRKLLPSPFAIAVILSGITFIIALFFSDSSSPTTTTFALTLFDYWYSGFWDAPLMVFAMQMMLMLVLGHALALSKPIDNLLSKAVTYCNTTSSSAAIVCFLTLLVSLFNWGLGLVFGAIFAGKTAENAAQKGHKINFPIIGAAGYSGLMVWHGGLSGSAPIKVAEPGHFLEAQLGIIPQTETIFSTLNLVGTGSLLIILPALFYWLGKNAAFSKDLPKRANPKKEIDHSPSGAENIDRSALISKVTGGIILLYIFYMFIFPESNSSLSLITPNFINMLLFGLAIFAHNSYKDFLQAVDSAVQGASGILIQFPFYFGIMGIMKHSGLTEQFSQFFISISTPETFPIYTMISAAVVNIFVPSGGGQWAVQGPILAEAALYLKVSSSKAVMALAYGDQLTNMLQPFWALPLLGITGLKAKDILPYSTLIMIVGFIIFTAVLLIF
jgi:short-chain fatty acids transporter